MRSVLTLALALLLAFDSSAARPETNGERLKRGRLPVRPKRLYGDQQPRAIESRGPGDRVLISAYRSSDNSLIGYGIPFMYRGSFQFGSVRNASAICTLPSQLPIEHGELYCDGFYTPSNSQQSFEITGPVGLSSQNSARDPDRFAVSRGTDYTAISQSRSGSDGGVQTQAGKTVETSIWSIPASGVGRIEALWQDGPTTDGTYPAVFTNMKFYNNPTVGRTIFAARQASDIYSVFKLTEADEAYIVLEAA